MLALCLSVYVSVGDDDGKENVTECLFVSVCSRGGLLVSARIFVLLTFIFFLFFVVAVLFFVRLTVTGLLILFFFLLLFLCLFFFLSLLILFLRFLDDRRRRRWTTGRTVPFLAFDFRRLFGRRIQALEVEALLTRVTPDSRCKLD